MGFSTGILAGYLVALKLVFLLVSSAIALAIFWRKPRERMALFVSVALITFGASLFIPTPTSLADANLAGWLFNTVAFLGNTSLALFFFLFPNGRFVPRWTMWLQPVLLAPQLSIFFLPDLALSRWLYGMRLVFSTLSLTAASLAQLYRYLKVSDKIQRQQTKWAVSGILAAILGAQAIQIAFSLAADHGILIILLSRTMYYLALLLIPVSIGIAISRYRLWEIDFLLNRGIVYGTLTLLVAGLYVLVVGSLGVIFQTSSNLLISVVATGVVAVLFQPMRDWLQWGANHLVYGERNNPYRVLSHLGQRLEATLAPEAILPTIVETVAQAMRLPYAAIELNNADHSSPTTVAAYGIRDGRARQYRVPLPYQGEQVGELVLVPGSAGEEFTQSDLRLLRDLAVQAAVAVRAVRLTAELQLMAADLQRSREQLVVAREEERRRLRRDLHDGLGPQLASQTFILAAVCKLLRTDPESAETLLGEAIKQAEEAVSDIRRVVYALRPPALDDLGLAGALKAEIDRYRASGVLITLQLPEKLPTLSAAVEVACYRIMQEALSNVVRHAHAHHCRISLEFEPLKNALQLEIEDDGAGLPASLKAGVGLSSMRERAEELGGTYEISRGRERGGTQISAILPLLSS
jgi:signal transduction histidine kinase